MIYDIHSNGKLLLTGEYLVLRGAEALALPLNRGQSLHIEPLKETRQIIWQSHFQNQLFFEARFHPDRFRIIQTSDQTKALYLQNLLRKAREQAPDTFSNSGYRVEAHLDFSLNWGLGSSSTLIANVARWLNIDPFILNHQINQGSGYDIAAAQSDQPILYRHTDHTPSIHPVDLELPFTTNLFFIYTGRKQHSNKEVTRYMANSHGDSLLDKSIQKISAINHRILNSTRIEEFEQALAEHEAVIARAINATPVQEKHFRDFPGTIKSLGAWGGDFILATWSGRRTDLEAYFKQHRMETLFAWNELVKGSVATNKSNKSANETHMLGPSQQGHE